MCKPQENGNHTDVRWTSLTDNDGNGILVAADGTVESSALHVKAENINPVSWTDYPYNNQTIRHSTEVPMDEQTYLCLDAIQRGVSNTGFFNHVPLEGFYPTTKQNADGSYNTYAERFRIVPVTSDTDKMEESKGRDFESKFCSRRTGRDQKPGSRSKEQMPRPQQKPQKQQKQMPKQPRQKQKK